MPKTNKPHGKPKPPVPPPPPPPPTGFTLRETIERYKVQLGVTAFPCKLPGSNCPDYIPNPVSKLDELCSTPWPLCLTCGNTAQTHDPGFVV